MRGAEQPQAYVESAHRRRVLGQGRPLVQVQREAELVRVRVQIGGVQGYGVQVDPPGQILL
ncbi:hypothetical protein GCM10010350_47530 [Streptomyces galilaeus]|nr:hypothetical protein GCM10010350_47530 [Streptomyces galilaeus]